MSIKEERMDRAAVLHIPLSQYAFAKSEHTLVIRIRAKKEDLSGCDLYYADRACRKTPIEFYRIPMHVCAEDACFQYYEAEIHSVYNRICYYFKLMKGQEWAYYYGDRFTETLADFYLGDQVVDGRSEYYQYPIILKEEIPDVPEWFKTAVVYNIFPDSFASGKRSLENRAEEKRLEDGRTCRSRLGGTLRGIRENLDYIQGMGFTCLYLNPVFSGGEYHKYDVLDYYHIDPCLGTEADFQELVEELHRRGMKIIIDGVFNHCSWEFFAFEDVAAKGRASRYCKWFYGLEFPVRKPENADEVPNYTCFAYERRMPKLNTAEREVQMYFADVGAYWIQKYHVDGWRLDVANEIHRNFWRSFRSAVKSADPDAVLIGEVWENAETWLRGDAFDSTMNYEFRRICRDYLSAGSPDGRSAACQFEQMRLRYPTNIVNGQLNLIDSHDVPRFLSLCRGDLGKWKMACILLMLMPGVPSLFYGDERKIQGIMENEYRKEMAWEEKEDVCDFVRELIRIRKEYIDGSTGYHPVWGMIRSGVFAFARENAGCEITAVMNPGEACAVPEMGERRVLLEKGCREGWIDQGGYAVWLRDKGR